MPIPYYLHTQFFSTPYSHTNVSNCFLLSWIIKSQNSEGLLQEFPKSDVDWEYIQQNQWAKNDTLTGYQTESVLKVSLENLLCGHHPQGEKIF